MMGWVRGAGWLLILLAPLVWAAPALGGWLNSPVLRMYLHEDRTDTWVDLDVRTGFRRQVDVPIRNSQRRFVPSPDHRWLAVWGGGTEENRGPYTDLVITPVPAGEPIQFRLRLVRIDNVQFGGDTLFVEASTGTARTLLAVDLVTGDIGELGIYDAYQPAFSPDGTQLVYLDISTNQPRLVYRRVGGEPQYLGPHMPSSFGMLSPSWSPTGTHFSFAARDPATDDRQLYVADVETLTAVNAFPGERLGASAFGQWSPDGQTLALTLGVRATADLALYDLRTGEMQRLENPGPDALDFMGVPAWSPDGAQIAYLGQGNTEFAVDVATLEVGTGGRTRYDLGPNAPYIGKEYLLWSPGGQYLAFGTQRFSDGSRNIYVADTRSGHVTRLLKEEQSRPIMWWR